MTLENVDTVFAFTVVMLLLSMVITILVQTVVVIGGLRGKNLLWGVTKVLEQSPALKAHATEIANKALRHPAVMTLGGRPATAIGSEELLTVLADLADPTNDSLGEQAKGALVGMLKSTVPVSSQVHAERLAEEFAALFKNESGKMQYALSLFEKKATQLTSDFETWFSMVMSRTTDRFIAHTRVWTILFAIVISFVLHIDSIDLIRQLSTDAEMRAKLIGVADQTLERADALLGAEPVAVVALRSVSGDLPEDARATIPASIASRELGEAWIKDSVSDDQLRSKLLEEYGVAFDGLVRERFSELGLEATRIKQSLEESRLSIISGDLPPFAEYAKWKHLLGVIISAALLSLGAPFWFNALRSLASLRPILAGKTDPSKGA